MGKGARGGMQEGSVVNDVVEDQYRRWCYPQPVDDMQEAILTGAYREIGDPVTYWPLFWPARRSAPDMDILVAGCGTNQAAYYACRNPGSRVLGIDLSESSLAHEQRLKERHGLDNLTLMRMDLVDLAVTGRDFDFITSTGVLHHLEDPVAGLSALRSVLRPEGVINVMVYGTSLRLGVYLMQDLFQTMGLGQGPEDVAIVRSIIGSLPEGHVLRRYLRVAPDLEYDAGIVDTFLHRRDRSYFVSEVFDLAYAAGLEFLSWCDPIEYSLAAHVSPGHSAWPRLRQLGDADAAHACDLLTQDRGAHRFALAHPAYAAACRIPFDSHEFQDCSVLLHPAVEVIDVEAPDDASIGCRRRGFAFTIDARLRRLLSVMADGTVSIGGALERLDLDPRDRQELLDIARTGFASLRSQGHVFVLLPE